MWPAQQKLKPGVPGEKSNDMCRETHRLSGFLFTDKRQNNFISQFGIFKGHSGVAGSLGVSVLN